MLVVFFCGSDIVNILVRAGWCVCVFWGGVGTERDGIKGR